MKPISKLVITLLAGGGLGFLAATALQAQSKPLAFVIEENDVINDGFFKEYASKVPPTIAAFGGEYVVRGGRAVSFLGEPPKRILILKFENLERAEAWYHSAAYQELQPLREKAMKKRSFVVEGLPKR